MDAKVRVFGIEFLGSRAHLRHVCPIITFREDLF